MSDDHLEEIKEIIALLKLEHLDGIALKLQEILDNTFSGTELIMAAKFNLEQIDKNKVSMTTQRRIDILIKKIATMLK